MKKQVIISFILGAIIFGGVGTILAYKLGANQVGYTPNDQTWNVSEVNTALDDLYDMATYGNATSSDIRSGKTALVNGNQITGNLTVPNYTTKTGTQNVAGGSSYSFPNGYYNMSNYKVSCGSCGVDSSQYDYITVPFSKTSSLVNFSNLSRLDAINSFASSSTSYTGGFRSISIDNNNMNILGNGSATIYAKGAQANNSSSLISETLSYSGKNSPLVHHLT